MPSLYKNNGIWYVSVSYKNKRISRSLKTRDHRIAKQLETEAVYNIINELKGKSLVPDLSFPELVDKYLSTDHDWSENTIILYKNVLGQHLANKPLPLNPTSRAIHIRTINTCWNWGLKNKLISKVNLTPGDTKGESSVRTYTKHELDLIFKSIKPESFNMFVKFAYYTGARSGEIRSISRENISDGSLITWGKTGRRIIKLNSQAMDIINNQNVLWNYSRDYVSHKFKKEVRRIGIKNARFHDLRRTFGLNLIKQGMSIYKVSKLLGHKSVRTTEEHYAPLLATEIEDFEL